MWVVHVLMRSGFSDRLSGCERVPGLHLRAQEFEPQQQDYWTRGRVRILRRLFYNMYFIVYNIYYYRGDGSGQRFQNDKSFGPFYPVPVGFPSMLK